MPERPDLSVIVVSYNTREMTLDCLRTLLGALDGHTAEVFLVDNASADGTVDAIRTELPAVRVVANADNRGFGAANNQALGVATGRYLLLLNSDAFPRPGAIAEMVRYMDTHPDVGVAGPRLLNADRSLQLSCFRLPSPRQAWFENLWISAILPRHPVFGNYYRWLHDAEREVDFVVGACMLVRREVYEAVGGFDERFFLYAEESDWQRRIRDAGWRVAFTPAAEVVHLGGASGASEPARVSRHFFESHDLYVLKHHGRLGLVSYRAATALGSLLRLGLWACVAVAAPGRRAVAQSKARLYGWLWVRQSTCWRPALRR